LRADIVALPCAPAVELATWISMVLACAAPSASKAVAEKASAIVFWMVFMVMPREYLT
jgi:hypothetical protein